MKTFIQAACIFLFIVLTILFMEGKFTNATLDTELENTLDASLEHALYVATSNNVYTIENSEELAADVMHELYSSCNTEAEYTIVFNVIDIDKGLVDMQVTQKIDNTESVCRKTIILNSDET